MRSVQFILNQVQTSMTALDGLGSGGGFKAGSLIRRDMIDSLQRISELVIIHELLIHVSQALTFHLYSADI